MNEWTDEEFKEYVNWCSAEYFLSELKEENEEVESEVDK